MKQTVAQGVSQRAVRDGDFETWANKEVLPFLKEARRGLNAKYVERVSYTTAGTGTAETLWTSDELPTGALITIEATVVAFSPSGPEAYALGDVATFYNPAGTVSQVGSTTSRWSHDTGGPGVTLAFAINADDTVSVRFTDDGTVQGVTLHVARLEVLT